MGAESWKVWYFSSVYGKDQSFFPILNEKIGREPSHPKNEELLRK